MDSQRAFPMPVTAHEVSGAGFFGQGRVSAGFFQVVVCANCGYTEWYAYELERLKEIPGARLVGADVGPYR
jgi:hypothetical protein